MKNDASPYKKSVASPPSSRSLPPRALPNISIESPASLSTAFTAVQLVVPAPGVAGHEAARITVEAVIAEATVDEIVAPSRMAGH